MSLLVMGAAVAVDGTRIVLADAEFQRAVDAAALAIGTTYADDATLDTIAQNFIDQNYDFGGTSVSNVDVVSTASEVAVTAEMQIELFFARIFVDDTLAVQVKAEVQRAGGGLMAALVLDNTGSMWSSLSGTTRIEALRTASLSLTESVFDGEESDEYVRLSVVPYAAMVNLGDEAVNAVDASQTSQFRVGDPDGLTGVDAAERPVLSYDPDEVGRWKGCVYERGGADSLADTPPSTAYWEPLIWPVAIDNQYALEKVSGDWIVDPDRVDPGGDRSSNSFHGPNTGCPTPILPLTDQKSEVIAALNDMTAWNRGGTLSDIGMAWGRRTLSKGAPFTDAATVVDPLTGVPIGDSTRWRKAVVLMTDGDNLVYNAGNHGDYVKKGSEKSDITGYGRLGDTRFKTHVNTGNATTAKSEVEKRLKALCEDMKSEDITIYTVVFSDSAKSSTKTIYQGCATDPGKYWYAPSADALDNAFGAIGADLNRLRITG